jgi:hypothetical protein
MSNIHTIAAPRTSSHIPAYRPGDVQRVNRVNVCPCTIELDGRIALWARGEHELANASQEMTFAGHDSPA